MLKMETRTDGCVLAVLAAYQNNLVTSKVMTSQVVQCLLFQMSTKVDFRSESLNRSNTSTIITDIWLSFDIRR